MAGHTKVPDKKTVVAIIIIAILVIAAIVGTVAFLKNRGTTEATDLESYNEQTTGTTQEEQTTTDTQEQSGEPTTESAEEQTTKGTEPATTEPTETADTDTTTAGGNQGTGATGTTAGRTTTTTDNIQDTTILREETVTTPTHAEDRIWEPRELQASFASAYSNINSVEPTDITVTKTAETQSGSTLVQAGEEITYTITVKNNTDEKIERIYVTDVIPEGTTYVEPEEEIANLTEFRDEQDNVTSLRWLVDVEPTVDGVEGTTTVSFKVKVNDDATGTIENFAIANDETSETVKTSIIKTEKTSAITREGTKVEAPAKEGDIITYTISVENTGDVDGRTTVKDTDLKSILENNAEIQGEPQAEVTVGDKTYSVEQLMNEGINIEVPAKAIATVVFSVKVTNIDGAITNVALVGDNEKPTEPEEVDTLDFTIDKKATLIKAEGNEVIDKAELGDTIHYVITIDNKGNTELVNLLVTDEKLGISKTVTVPAQTEQEVLSIDYTVTQEDINKQENILNKAVATLGDDTEEDTEEVPVVDEDKSFRVDKTSEIIKAQGNEVAGKAEEGDTIRYTVTVYNEGNVDLTGIVVKDEKLNREETVNVTVEAGSVVAMTADYTVTQEDINKQEDILNTVVATLGDDKQEDTEKVPVVEKVSNINIEKGVAELKEGVFTTLSNEALDRTIYEVGDSVWYAIKVTNNGNARDTATVTDTLVAGLSYAGEAKINDAVTNATGVSVNGQTITWETTLEKGETKTLYIKATVNSNAISGKPISSEITGKTTDWWDTNNSEKPVGDQEQTAQLFIRLDGKIQENDQNQGQDENKYTACVGTVNLTQKNLNNADRTTNENAIKIGTETTPTTVEGYSLLNYKIFQYIIDGTDLETIANAINNGNYKDPDQNKVTFNPETEMIVCYVLKYEDNGYHIDAVIRDRVQTRVDLYKVGNTATVNDKTSSVDINVSTTTELTKYTVAKTWNDAGKENERPEIDVNLYDNEGNFEATAELNKDNNWTYTFVNLDKKDSNGNDIQYTAKEVSIDVENEKTTIYEEGQLNGKYIVSYDNSEEGKTVITNTYSQPNITVEKTQSSENTVEYGDEITYTITATNNGTAEGKVTIKDDVPTNTTLKPGTAVNVVVKTIDGKSTEVPTTTITIDQLKAGYPITVEDGRKIEVSFTVVVNDGYAGDVVENTANYQNAGEEEKQTDTVTSKIEDTVNVVTTTTTEQSQGQNVILVLDLSGSMTEHIQTGTTEERPGRPEKPGKPESASKLSLMKSAVNTFLGDFLDNPNNQVMVITYSNSAQIACGYTNDATKAYNSIGNWANGGTNIDAGLTLANSQIANVDTKNTSVILMTDGIPGAYVDADGKNQTVYANGNWYDETAGEETVDAGEALDSRGVKVYTIGFGVEDEDALDMLKRTASGSEYYYATFDGDALEEAFKSISTSITVNNDPVSMETQDGKITLTSGFEVGQNVEFYYTENYNSDNVEGSTPYETISWNEFIDKSYVEYNETEGTLSLDLGAYMESKSMEPNEEITIRFVRDITVQTRIAPANILSLAITGIEDETINEETVSTYEEKINETEANKDIEITKPADTNKTENVETTKPDNEAGNVEDNTENTTEGENITEEPTIDKEEPAADQEETTNTPTVEEKPEAAVEEPITGTTTETENTVEETTSNINEENIQ